MEPRSDVCYKCNHYRKLIMDSVTEEDKLVRTDAYNIHVQKARMEHEFYNASIKSSADKIAPRLCLVPTAMVTEFRTHTLLFLFCHEFTFASSMPPGGSLYFLATIKVHCFGICYEAAKKRVNFLLNEGDSIGRMEKRAMGQM